MITKQDVLAPVVELVLGAIDVSGFIMKFAPLSHNIYIPRSPRIEKVGRRRR